MANEKTVMAVIRAVRLSFRNNHDKFGFAVHASFLASGCVLTATGPAAFSDTAFSFPSTDEFKNLEELVKSLDAQILFKLDGSSQPISSSNDSSDHSSDYEAPINPIGGSDLFPGPGPRMYPTRGDFGIGGSMLLGPNDLHWLGLGGVAGDPTFPGRTTG
ncbi:hypothetical protein FH972_009861 [Carpinus fangiana]|uniref:Uncharacterized protein n=1 Tax=Carpinus fangiana TaxID=176857 RepID=A0A660KNG9_9ROSI|nr:hypothetical protein FH972_009861 [Carpinus fangiana]